MISKKNSSKFFRKNPKPKTINKRKLEIEELRRKLKFHNRNFKKLYKALLK